MTHRLFKIIEIFDGVPPIDVGLTMTNIDRSTGIKSINSLRVVASMTRKKVITEELDQQREAVMSMKSKSTLSFYRSGEMRAQPRGGLLIAAGRCTCTTTSTCVACVEIVIEVDAT